MQWRISISIIHLEFLNTVLTHRYETTKSTVPGISGGAKSSLGIQQPPCSSEAPQPISATHSPEWQKRLWSLIHKANVTLKFRTRAKNILSLIVCLQGGTVVQWVSLLSQSFTVLRFKLGLGCWSLHALHRVHVGFFRLLLFPPTSQKHPPVGALAKINWLSWISWDIVLTSISNRSTDRWRKS